MDPNIVSPPMDFIPGLLPQKIALAIVLASFIPVITLAISIGRRERSPMPAFVLAGGFLSMICEPYTNVTHHVFHGAQNMTLISLMGRHIPAWAALTWPIFTGGGMLFLYDRLRQPGGLPGRSFWVVVSCVVLTNIVMEIPMLHYDAYRYYGPQALVVLGIPAWWLLINVTGPVLGGLILFRFRNWFVGPRMLALILLPTVASIAGIMSTTFPIFIAMNGNETGPLLQVSGLLSGLIGFFLLYICGLIATAVSRQSDAGASSAI